MLELIDVCYAVKGKQILNNINITFKDEITVITGANGAGKSTLAKIIMGILKPTSGKILLDGQDITNFNITERAKMGIAFAFQQPVKFKGLKVFDLLRLASPQKDIALSVYLRDVGLCAKDYLMRELSGELSGGELKRIEIASALARHSKVTIFDEPEAGIDLWSFSNLVDTFKRFQQEVKGTLIMISHQEKMIQLADTIVVLDSGKVEKMGKTQDILPNLSMKTCSGCGGDRWIKRNC